MTELIPVENISGKIFMIRGHKVMLDRDLAELYGVETKQLKRAVRRNIDRFPADFMFELTYKEYNSLRCQIGTLERKGKYSKYLSMAFTEQGGFRGNLKFKIENAEQKRPERSHKKIRLAYHKNVFITA